MLECCAKSSCCGWCGPEQNLGFFKSKSTQVVCLILQAPGWDELENCSLLHLTSLPWHPSIMLCIYFLHFIFRIWMSQTMLFSSISLWAQTPETPCCKHHFTFLWWTNQRAGSPCSPSRDKLNQTKVKTPRGQSVSWVLFALELNVHACSSYSWLKWVIIVKVFLMSGKT